MIAIEPSCECGALVHEDAHELAIAAEIAAATPGCTCPGYASEDGEPAHDGLCDLSEVPQ